MECVGGGGGGETFTEECLFGPFQIGETHELALVRGRAPFYLKYVFCLKKVEQRR